MRLRSLLIVTIVVVLSGCGSAPLVPVSYDGNVVAQSDLPAFVTFNTGVTKGHSSSSAVYVEGVFVPVSTGPAPLLQFGAEDQSMFVDSLKSEMQRLGIVGTVVDTRSSNALSVNINFVHTEHFPNYQEYKLTVSMLMAYRDQTIGNRYEVLSSEGDSIWKKMNTNASKGKEKAATKLLTLILDDIQKMIQEIDNRTATSPQNI